jgi:hypothetical protein
MSVDEIRLQAHEIAILKDAFRQHFMATDHIWIFGSRADPQAREGIQIL